MPRRLQPSAIFSDQGRRMNADLARLMQSVNEGSGLGAGALIDALYAIRAPRTLEGIVPACRQFRDWRRAYPELNSFPELPAYAERLALLDRIADLELNDDRLMGRSIGRIHNPWTPLFGVTGDSVIAELLLIRADRTESSQGFERASAWLLWQAQRFHTKFTTRIAYEAYLVSESGRLATHLPGRRLYEAYLALRVFASTETEAKADLATFLKLIHEWTPAASNELARLFRMGFEHLSPFERGRLAENVLGRPDWRPLVWGDAAKDVQRVISPGLGRLLETLWMGLQPRAATARWQHREFFGREVEHPQIIHGKCLTEILQRVGTGGAHAGTLLEFFAQGPRPRRPRDAQDVVEDDPIEPVQQDPAVSLFLADDADLMRGYYAARGQQNAIEYSNAMLRWSRWTLSQPAIATLLAVVRDPPANDEAFADRCARLALGLMLLTGRPLEHVAGFRITDEPPVVSPTEPIAIALNTHRLYLYPGQPDLRRPPEESLPFCYPRARILSLPLPSDWWRLVDAIGAAQKGQREEVATAMRRKLREFGGLEGHTAELRVTERGIRHTFLHALAERTRGDLGAQQVLTDVAEADSRNIIHYGSYPATELEGQWRAAAETLVGSLSKPDVPMKATGYVGAQHAFNIPELAAYFGSIRERIRAAKEKAEWPRMFNLLTLYLAYWLGLGVAGRKTLAPVPSIVLEGGWALVVDKHRVDGSTDRLVPLTEALRAQVAAYVAFARELSLAAPQLDPINRTERGNELRLQYIHRTKGVVPYRPKYQEQDEQLIPLPANWGRKVVRSASGELPGRYRDAELGHWVRGRHAWDATSTFSAREFRARWLTLQGQLETRLGFEIVRPIPDAPPVDLAPLRPAVERPSPPPEPLLDPALGAAVDVIALLREADPGHAVQLLDEKRSLDPQAGLTLARRAVESQAREPVDRQQQVAEAVCQWLRERKKIPIFASRPRALVTNKVVLSAGALQTLAYLQREVLPAFRRDLECLPARPANVERADAPHTCAPVASGGQGASGLPAYPPAPGVDTSAPGIVLPGGGSLASQLEADEGTPAASASANPSSVAGAGSGNTSISVVTKAAGVEPSAVRGTGENPADTTAVADGIPSTPAAGSASSPTPAADCGSIATRPSAQHDEVSEQSPPLPLPGSAATAPSAIVPAALAEGEAGRTAGDRHLCDIELGRLVMLAIWRLGLARWSLIDRWLRALWEGLPVLAQGPNRYQVLAVRTEHAHEGIERTVFLDDFTAAYLAIEHARVRRWLDPWFVGTLAPRRRARAERVLAAYMGFLSADCETVSLTQMTAAACQAMMLQSAPVIAAYARGALNTCDLGDRELRRLGGLQPSRASGAGTTPKLPALKVLDVADDELPKDLLLRVPIMRALGRHSSPYKSEWRRLIGGYDPTSPVERLLQSFALWLLDHGDHVQRAKLSQHTKYYVAGRIKVISHALLGYVGLEPDPGYLDGDVLDELQEVSRDEFPDRLQHGAWYQFHLFLADPKADHAGFTLGALGPPPERAVSAKILSAAELAAMWTRLASVRSNITQPELRTSAQHHVELMITYGMRRAESAYLRSLDYQQDLCRVQAYGDHTLKTSWSDRVLPIGFAEDRVQAWLREAHRQEFVQLIDAAPHTPANPDNFFDCVNQLVKEVTSDRSMGSHHLRHTLVSRLVLSLLWDAAGLEYLAADMPWLRGLRIAPERLRVLLGAEGDAGQGLRALAALVGHSHPTTTIRHYVHILGIALRGALEQGDFLDLARSFENRMGGKSTYQRWVTQAHAGLPLDSDPDVRRRAVNRALRDRIEDRFAGSGIDRDETPHTVEPPDDPSVDAISLARLEQVDQSLRDGHPRLNPEIVEAYREGLQWLAGVTSGKRGWESTHLRHPLEEGERQPGIWLPRRLAGGTAAVAADVLCRWLERVRTTRPDDFAWLLAKWTGASEHERGRLRLDDADDVNRAVALETPGQVTMWIEGAIIANARTRLSTKELSRLRVKCLNRNGHRINRDILASRWVLSYVVAYDHVKRHSDARARLPAGSQLDLFDLAEPDTRRHPGRAGASRRARKPLGHGVPHGGHAMA